MEKRHQHIFIQTLRTLGLRKIHIAVRDASLDALVVLQIESAGAVHTGNHLRWLGKISAAARDIGSYTLTKYWNKALLAFEATN